MIISIFTEKLNFFWSYSSVIALENQPENLDFKRIFATKRTFDGYLERNVCTYIQKNIAEQGIMIPNLSQTL